jgi:queuine tRNA-ribosyltransferase
VTDHNDFTFKISDRDGTARTGAVHTPRGTIRTPAFMPVGTAGTVKAMHPHEVRALGADIVLGNVYHLMLRPGAERVAELGGLHHMMNWPHPILTDSGGFQVMSLAKLRKITEQGVTFRSHIDGSSYELTPERSIEIQGLLGSDIQMQLDECVKLPCSDRDTEKAMELSLRWAERCVIKFGTQPGKAMFGIVQGGAVEALRVRSAQQLANMNLKGYSIGGLAVGEPQEIMLKMIEVVEPHLPQEKPRYLMGVGTPDDIVESVRRGVDMFDCVMPTRAGRHGLAFTRFGKINLKNARHADDPRPLDEESSWEPARIYSRAYLHHLVKSEEILGMMLLTGINLAYYQTLMAGLRSAISEQRLNDFIAHTKAGWERGDLPPYTRPKTSTVKNS